MARFDPLRGGLVNDDDDNPRPRITQCEGMILAFDPAGPIIGRRFDPLLGRIVRQRATLALAITASLVASGPNYDVYVNTIDHNADEPAENASYSVSTTGGTFLDDGVVLPVPDAGPLKIGTWMLGVAGDTLSVFATCASHNLQSNTVNLVWP